MIVAGFGFRKAAEVESLHDAYQLAVGTLDVSQIATLEAKVSAPAFAELSRHLRRPSIGVSEAEASRIDTATQSAQSLKAHNTGSVAEATALAAAGPFAELVTPRVVSQDGMATCAIARSITDGDEA